MRPSSMQWAEQVRCSRQETAWETAFLCVRFFSPKRDRQPSRQRYFAERLDLALSARNCFRTCRVFSRKRTLDPAALLQRR